MIKILYRNHLAGSRRLFNFYVISQQSQRVNFSISLLDEKKSSDEIKLLRALQLKKDHILGKLNSDS